ncbi:MAG TPA: S8 family serine peptidase, partial [Acidobacteriota bacterium]|nr:S8 family serine peptidase [Acidobacteriota bacterium]
VGVAGGYSNGTATGTANGVKLMCLRIGWQAKDGYGYVRMDFAAEAVQYAVLKKWDGHNVVALNCSWGTSSTGGFAAAVDLALANDIMIIHAAGNGGNDTPDYLGGKAGVMNVAATDSNDVRCSFSDYGDWVDLAAPGDDIMTTYHSFDDPDYDYVVVIGGTSFSSPLTCGVAALLESLDPTLTGPEKFDIIVSTGDDIGSQNVGLRLNARNALDAVGACVDAAPPNVTVVTPNGGESVEVESTLVVTWDASDDCLVAETEVRLDRGDDGVFEEPLAVLTGNPGSYSWDVTGPATSVARIQIVATDGESNTTADASDGTFAVTINQAPVLVPLAPQTVDEGDNLNLVVSATDVDGDSVVLSAQGVPVNASFTDQGDGSGTFDFDPDYTQAGLFELTFAASDGTLADTQAVSVTVTNVNRAPVLDPISAQLVDEGQNLSFGVAAADPDGDGVDLAAVDVPDNAVFTDQGGGAGLFTFDPDYTQAGTYEVLITASDGAAEDSVIVSITVADAPPPCECDCHADPLCDAQTDVLDVVRLIEVAFRGGASLTDPNPLCPHETTDVNCDGVTSILDAVLIVDVAFRGSDPQTSFTAPCP